VVRFDYLEGLERHKTDWCSNIRDNVRVAVFNRSLGGLSARIGASAEKTAVELARRWVPANIREALLRLRSRLENRGPAGNKSL
jgi:hypothetical protein